MCVGMLQSDSLTTRVEQNLLFKQHASEDVQHGLDTKQMKQLSEWIV